MQQFKKTKLKTQYDLDCIPYVDFIEFFKSHDRWRDIIAGPESPLLRLITASDHFFKRKLIEFQKGDESQADLNNSILGVTALPVKELDFNKERSSIKAVAFDGLSQTFQIIVDIPSVKMLALILCKASLKEKASVFFDIVIGMEKVKK